MFDWLFEPVEYWALIVVLVTSGIIRGVFEDIRKDK